MVLNGDHLTYYQPPSGLKAKGLFRLLSTPATLVYSSQLPPNVSSENLIELQTHDGSLSVAFDSDADKKRWLEAFSSSVLPKSDSLV
jgi:hypothetical protein